MAISLISALAVGSTVFGPASSASAAEPAVLHSLGGNKLPGDLDVMTFNVRSVIEEEVNSGRNYNAEGRREAIAGAILNELPDLIGTQENVRWQADDLWVDLKNAGHQYEWYGEMRECDGDFEGCGDQGETVGIFWRPDRLSIRDQGDFWFCADGQGSWQGCVDAGDGWQAHHPRMATWIRFFDNQTLKEFYAVNTHLETDIWQAQYHGMQIIQDTMARINQDDLPIVLTGDFNSTKWEAAYKLADGNGYRDTWGAAAVKGTKYKSSKRWVDDEPVPGTAVDFIFTKVGWTGATVSAAGASIYRHSNGRYPSDHLPVLARVRLPAHSIIS